MIIQQKNRRQFLCLAAAAGSAAGLSTAAWLRLVERHRQACSTPSAMKGDSTQPFTATCWALGSKVTITALHRCRQTAERAVARAFTELELVEDLMSIYRRHSQVSRLNQCKVLHQPHRYLVEVLQQAAAMSQRTRGAFDITVQPLWSLHADAGRRGRPPGRQAVAAACRHIDWRRVEVATNCIRLRGEATAVTLNGIAQGFAADRVLAALRRGGVEHALVDTGEIGSLGTKQHQPWKVGIQHPRHRDAYLSLARLQDRCLATSGDYATNFGADFQTHHLFDPDSGYCPHTLCSVSVAARSAMQADALSTAVFVMGVERGLQLICATPGADALLMTKDGELVVTEGFPIET